MERREFITLVGGAAVAWPHAARAQQSKIPRIGVLWHAATESEEAPYLGPFRQGLLDLGHVESKNIALENRFAAEHYERFDALAAELVGLKIDVLVAVTQPAALAAQRATTIIPIVFILVADPVASKLVESLAHPGGNITGLSNVAFEMFAKRVELLKQMVPSISRLALLVNPSDPQVARRTFDESRAAADRLNMTLEQVEARAPGDLEQTFSIIVEKKFDGIVITNDPMLFNERQRIGEWAISHKIPTMMFNGEMPGAGGVDDGLAHASSGQVRPNSSDQCADLQSAVPSSWAGLFRGAAPCFFAGPLFRVGRSAWRSFAQRAKAQQSCRFPRQEPT